MKTLVVLLFSLQWTIYNIASKKKKLFYCSDARNTAMNMKDIFWISVGVIAMGCEEIQGQIHFKKA